MVGFGRFEFDPLTRRLRREGVDIHLAPKCFELLVALLDCAPRVVSKRELHARLWPGGVVADATLVAVVKQLRAALEDRDRAAPLVRTVHRVGYALEAPLVHREPAAPAAQTCWLTVGGRRIYLQGGENIVGRDADAKICLRDPTVSRRHARIEVGESGAVLEDLGSKNGTFINGEQASSSPMKLGDGTSLAFGTALATYGESASGLPTLTQAGSGVK
jgi:DNA-binding winged helix-turn-helix (wHTH) protein